MIDFSEEQEQGVNTADFYKQKEISREIFFAIRDENEKTHRKIFKSSAVQKKKKPGSRPTFSVAFGESILPQYEKSTGFSLNYSARFGNFWHYLQNEEEIQKAEEWEKQQGDRVFLKDCLFSSIALAIYKEGEKFSDPGRGFRLLKYDSTISEEKRGKILEWIIEKMCAEIISLHYYSDCKYICAVPPRPGKTSPDYPSIIAQEIAKRLGIADVTDKFIYEKEKAQAKELSRNEKWEAWDNSGLRYSEQMAGEDIILIDDLYQSGISVNYVAMVLRKAGFGKICGLYIVKSLNDRDNIQIAEDSNKCENPS